MDIHLKKIIVSSLFKTLGNLYSHMQAMHSENQKAPPLKSKFSEWINKTGLSEDMPFIVQDGKENAIDKKSLKCFAIVSEAEQLLNLSSGDTIATSQQPHTSNMLFNIFNSVILNDGEKSDDLYFTPRKTGDEIPYPVPLDQLDQCLSDDVLTLWNEFEQDLLQSKNNLNVNLLLMLIEKYFSFLPHRNSLNLSFEVSVYQQAKLSAALAADIFNSLFEEPNCEMNNIKNRTIKRHLLIGGDISGVQDFIYTIASTGALKNLRGRSFYLEMLTEKVVKDITQQLDISSANLIFSGGGGFYMLAQNTQKSCKIIKTIKKEINQWLFTEFETKLYFNIDYVEFCGNDIVVDSEKEYPFTSVWKQLSWKIEASKSKKFHGVFHDIFKTQMPHNLHESCPVCHTDEKDLDGEIKGLKTCRICSNLSNISKLITQHEKYRFIYENDGDGDFFIQDTFYKFAEKQTSGKDNFIINSWDINDWTGINGTQLLIGNYSSGCKDLEELSARSHGKNLIGALRMDVDNLGSVFIQGLPVKSITRMSELSRRLTLFFKYYINFICKGIIRDDDRHIVRNEAARIRDVDIIYSGGDDLFILGAWDQTAEISFDIRKIFNRYTGNNPWVTLSAGMTLHQPNFPVYQIAQLSKDAEHEAKTNDNKAMGHEKQEKDSISLFYTDTMKKKNAFYCERNKKRRHFDRGPYPEKIISQAQFWDDAEKDIFVMTCELYNDINWSKVSHNFFRKLFDIIETWQKDGVLYLPSLHYLINRSKKELGKSSVILLEKLEPGYMPKLQIPLTWVEYLHRKEGN